MDPKQSFYIYFAALLMGGSREPPMNNVALLTGGSREPPINNVTLLMGGSREPPINNVAVPSPEQNNSKNNTPWAKMHNTDFWQTKILRTIDLPQS